MKTIKGCKFWVGRSKVGSGYNLFCEDGAWWGPFICTDDAWDWAYYEMAK